MTTIISKLEGPLSEIILAEFGKILSDHEMEILDQSQVLVRFGLATLTDTSSAVGVLSRLHSFPIKPISGCGPQKRSRINFCSFVTLNYR